MAQDPETSSVTNSPIPEHMLDSIIKTFILSHTEAGDQQLAQTLVYNVSRLAWRLRDAGVKTEQKTSVSDVVTEADRIAEKFVSDVLRALRPEDGLLGEEGTRHEGTSGRTWVIDPIDGTYNFTTGSDYWCSALALVKGDPDDPDELILGAVHRPAMGYTWIGGPDIPTTRDGSPVPKFQNPAPEETVLGGYLHPTHFTNPVLRDAWIAVAGQFATVRMLGSASIDLACVAGGELGCWTQHSVASWDWLPGRALVEGSGGTTTKVTAAGRTWSIAGSAKAVEAAKLALDPL